MTKEFMKNLLLEEKKYMRLDSWYSGLSDEKFERYWAEERFNHLG